MKKIITADDFGFSKSVNEAIAELLINGSISQTSIMMNQEYTQHAIELIKKYNLKNIGLHFNLTQGYSTIDKNTLFSKDKIFELDDSFIYSEFKNQLELFKQIGIELHHIDSHHYIHEDIAFIKELMYKELGKNIRNDTCELDTTNDILFLKSFTNKAKEIVCHPATRVDDLYDKHTILIDSRLSEYLYLKKHNDIINKISYNMNENYEY